MARSFPCRKCGSEILVRHLRPGEEALCRNCGGRTAVPESASEVERQPDYVGASSLGPADAEEHAKDPSEGLTCPNCGEEMNGERGAHCTKCNVTWANVRLYNPVHFIWQGLLFSALVPLVQFADNWGIVGRRRLKRIWLVGGIGGFTAVTVILSWLAFHFLASRGGKGLPVLLINLILTIELYDQQKALYAFGKRVGARPASTLKGTFKGLGLLVGYVVLVMIIFTILPA